MTIAEHTTALPSVPTTGRVQLALNVDDLDASITFYTALFGVGPAKRRPGYANFAIDAPPLKLVLLENSGRGGSLNHLGVEVATSQQVQAEVERLGDAGLVELTESGTCCFATQDKVWVSAPDGERWEVYTVLADSPTFGVDSSASTDGSTGACCAS